jgi:hypothetical protein
VLDHSCSLPGFMIRLCLMPPRTINGKESDVDLWNRCEAYAA